jgi:hypothetical protein
LYIINVPIIPEVHHPNFEIIRLFFRTSIIVSQLDRSGNTLRYYVMKNAYPNDIGAVGLDFGANDQLSSFQVAFQYQHYEVSTDFGTFNESQLVTGTN